MTEALKVKILLTICTAILALVGYAGADFYRTRAREQKAKEERRAYQQQIERARRQMPTVRMDVQKSNKAFAESLRRGGR